MSRWDRLLVFAACNLGALACFVICFFLFPVLSLKPRKFAILYVHLSYPTPFAIILRFDIANCFGGWHGITHAPLLVSRDTPPQKAPSTDTPPQIPFTKTHDFVRARHNARASSFELRRAAVVSTTFPSVSPRIHFLNMANTLRVI